MEDEDRQYMPGLGDPSAATEAEVSPASQPESAASPPPARSAAASGRRRALAAVALVVLGALLGSAGGVFATLAVLAPARRLTLPPAPIPVRPVVFSGEADVVSIYRQVAPAVVQIVTPTGAGSGFIFDPGGYILTNNHVVERFRRVQVVLDDRQLPGQVLGTDPGNDVAVVKIDPGGQVLPVIPLGDSDAVQPGEPAIAIGFPLDEGKSVTAGIISGTGRVSGGGVSEWMLSGLIQTDAAINPGNSGGPLLNAAGQVIGINTLIASPVRGFTGIGFAVPVNAVRAVLPDLIAGRKVEHPWLGISGRAVTPQVAQEEGLPVTSGVLIADVYKDTAAAQAGLQPGDVITAVDGRPLRDITQLLSYLGTRKVGDRVRLSVQRGRQSLTLEGTLTARPDRSQLR